MGQKVLVGDHRIGRGEAAVAALWFKMVVGACNVRKLSIQVKLL